MSGYKPITETRHANYKLELALTEASQALLPMAEMVESTAEVAVRWRQRRRASGQEGCRGETVG